MDLEKTNFDDDVEFNIEDEDEYNLEVFCSFYIFRKKIIVLKVKEQKDHQ